MGSYGVALLTAQRLKKSGNETTFVGIDFDSSHVKLVKETCKICNNYCDITFAEVEGLDFRPSWGYMCGRDAEETKVRRCEEYKWFTKRNGLYRKKYTLPGDAPKPRKLNVTLGIMRSLITWEFYPLYRAILESLGFDLKLSTLTNHKIVDMSTEWVGADYCFPAKLAHGHCRDLLEDPAVDFVFAPYAVGAFNSDQTHNSCFCPYNTAQASFLTSAISLNSKDPERDVKRILSPVVDLRLTPKVMAARLHETMGQFGLSEKDVLAAVERGLKVWETYQDGLQECGRQALAELEADPKGKPGVVIIGRPYNVFDSGANLDLPKKLAQMGFPVIPMDFLPLDSVQLDPDQSNMYWAYGRKILQAAKFVSQHERLSAVYFTNFSCGPDAFIQTYVETTMGHKPLLMLELDEHGADAGYITRLEAFADVLSQTNVVTWNAKPLYSKPFDKEETLKDRVMWIPPIQTVSTELVAAIIRGSGQACQPMPEETPEAYELGRTLTRGTECVPCPTVIGNFIVTARNYHDKDQKHAILMTEAHGPCRYGQYRTLQRILLNEQGMEDTPIVFWSARDSYAAAEGYSRRRVFQAIVVGDLLFKMRNRAAPYFRVKAEADEMLLEFKRRIADAYENKMYDSVNGIIREAARRFHSKMDHSIPRKPIVGVVGEIYIRTNKYINKGLFNAIEEAGGEAWAAPIAEWVLYAASMEAYKAKHNKEGMLKRAGVFLKNHVLYKDFKDIYALGSPLLDDSPESDALGTIREGTKYMSQDFEGEALCTVGRAVEFIRHGASLVVNVSPFGCMPGNISMGIFEKVQDDFNASIVSVVYDGDSDGINDKIDVYMSNLRKGQ